MTRSTRRRFLAQATAPVVSGMLSAAFGATNKGPNDFVIVEGHRDIWELTGRTHLKDEAQHLPLTNFIIPRLIEGGVSVCVMPAGGDSLEERDDIQGLLEAACACST